MGCTQPIEPLESFRRNSGFGVVRSPSGATSLEGA
jgi:hypothetical protein